MHELSVDEIAANEGVDFADGVYPEFAVLERERLGDYSQETIHKRIHDTRQGLIHANAFAKGAGLSRAQRLAAVRFAREEYWDNDYDIPLIEALRLVVEVRWTGVHGSDAHLVALRLHREQEHLDRAERRRKHFEAQARLGEALGRRALPSVRASVTRAQAACCPERRPPVAPVSAEGKAPRVVARDEDHWPAHTAPWSRTAERCAGSSNKRHPSGTIRTRRT